MATIFLNPTVAPEGDQPSALVTTVSGYNMSFDSFAIRAGNQYTNGTFDNIKIGTSFSDVVNTVAPEPGTLTLLAAGVLSLLAYAWRKRR